MARKASVYPASPLLGLGVERGNVFMASAAAVLKGRALERGQYLGMRKPLHPWDTIGPLSKWSSGEGWPQVRRPRNSPGEVVQR